MKICLVSQFNALFGAVVVGECKVGSIAGAVASWIAGGTAGSIVGVGVGARVGVGAEVGAAVRLGLSWTDDISVLLS
jgi:hypothetical protein